MNFQEGGNLSLQRTITTAEFSNSYCPYAERFTVEPIHTIHASRQ